MGSEFQVFCYYPGGVIISYKRLSVNINWEDISQINAFKVDLITTDRVEMEIICRNTVISINEDFQGWHQFVVKTKEIFPALPRNWDVEIIQPPLERNFVTLYNKV